MENLPVINKTAPAEPLVRSAVLPVRDT